MKFMLHYSPKPTTLHKLARDLFPVFISEHANPQEAVDEAVKRFGFLELDRCSVRIVGGEFPDIFRPIKVCAVCNRPYAGYGRVCPDNRHSRRQVMDAYGATDKDSI